MIRFELVFLAVLSVTYAAQDSVQVQLYYETLCPDCINFIKNQLHSTYQTFGSEKIKLELIPWGKASEKVLTNGTREFTCQHGPNECYGNKVHACAISFAPIEKAENFVYCSEKGTPYDNSNLKQCADNSGISWKNIESCLVLGHGDEILSENGKKTAKIPLNFVPSVVIDGKFNEDDVNRATYDFKGLVCEKLGNVKECK